MRCNYRNYIYIVAVRYFLSLEYFLRLLIIAAVLFHEILWMESGNRHVRKSEPFLSFKQWEQEPCQYEGQPENKTGTNAQDYALKQKEHLVTVDTDGLTLWKLINGGFRYKAV